MGSKETLSNARDLMFKIGQFTEPFNVLKHLFFQESVAVASCFVISRMHWSHVWKQILRHLFLMVWVGVEGYSSLLRVCLYSERSRS